MSKTDLALRARLVQPNRTVDDAVVVVGDGVVVAVHDLAADGEHAAPAEAVRLPGLTLLPGLVDVHCHGGGGHSFATDDEDEARAAAEHHLAHGTTTVQASLVSAAEADLLRWTEVAAGLADGGVVAGIHLEGPFLATARCGAQDPTTLRPPELTLVRRLLTTGRGHVRTVTLAPELPGASDAIAAIADGGAVAAVGHTDADAATTSAAFDAGATLVTHLFNGMRPWHHRDPGPVAPALRSAARGDAVLEVIGDGVHLDDATVAMLFAVLGPGRIALVSDAMAAAGVGDGSYVLGPQRVEVSGGVARLAGGGSIAGSTSHLLDVVRRAVQHAGIPLTDAVRAASTTPATVLGRSDLVGGLTPGHRADLVCVDDDLRPVAVMRSGRWVGGSGALPEELHR